MKTYKVLFTLVHNGKRYEIGDSVELSEVDAAPLINSSFVTMILEPDLKTITQRSAK